MPDEVPTGNRAVFAFLEMVALAFAFEGAARLLDGKYLLGIVSLGISIVFFVAGLKWPKIKIKAGTKSAHYLNLRPTWIAVFVVFSVYALQKPTALDLVMDLHRRWHGWFGYAIFGSVGAILLCAYWWLTGLIVKPIQQKGGAKPEVTSAGQDEKPPTLLDLFTKDLSNTMKLTDDAIGIQWKDGELLHIKRQLYLDFPAKSKFVGFYLPTSNPMSSAKSFEACLKLAEENAIQQALDDMPKKVAVSGGFRGEMNSIQDLTFSGRVLIYHDAFLSITQKADIIRAYAARQFDVQFRGPDYLGDRIAAWHSQQDQKTQK